MRPVPGGRPAEAAGPSAGGPPRRGDRLSAIDRPLGPAFFARDTLQVARDLLGATLHREMPDGRHLGGRIVEVEAYLGPDDQAAHSARGLTPRTRTMFGPPGRAYVYLIYGIWHCLNFVTRPEGEPQAVLLRALEPLPGTGRCSGPGLLCQALEIDRSLDGAPLEPPALYVKPAAAAAPPDAVRALPRIGVDYAGEWAARPWRFCLDSPALSRPLPRLRESGPAGR